MMGEIETTRRVYERSDIHLPKFSGALRSASVVLALAVSVLPESLRAEPLDLPASSPTAADSAPDAAPHSNRAAARQTLIVSITIFVLAIIVGVELISKVPTTLHTPLMSGSNAISGITVVGAIVAAGAAGGVASWLGLAAVVLAMINVVGGFLVTNRMLLMFRRK
jgi:NAD(P) transhydrogenase subunit alpha